MLQCNSIERGIPNSFAFNLLGEFIEDAVATPIFPVQRKPSTPIPNLSTQQIAAMISTQINNLQRDEFGKWKEPCGGGEGKEEEAIVWRGRNRESAFAWPLE